jgi:Uma2 family endonuclease
MAPYIRELRRFTVAEYHSMVEKGIFKSGEPYELLDGQLVKKLTVNPPHSYTVYGLTDLLSNLLPEWLLLRIQQPVTLKESEPEPDLAVCIGPRSRYRATHPSPTDLLLVIEVADSSLTEDRTTRMRVYAEAKIVQYWIVNLADRQVEVHTNPRRGKNPGYRDRVVFAESSDLPLVLHGSNCGTLAVNELLP